MTRPSNSPAILSGLVCVLSATAAWAGPWGHDFDTAQAESRRTGKPMLVHVHAEWCGPCRAMERQTLHRPEVQRMLDGPVVGVLVNSDHHQDIVRQLGVRSLPTDLLIDARGRELYRSSGFKKVGPYVAALSAPAGRSYAMNRPTPKAGRQRPLVAQKDPAPRTRPSAQQTPAETASAGATVPLDMVAPPMLRGFSPVALNENREWVKGSREFAVDYRGQTYLLASAAERAAFEDNPRRYTPRLLGCDAVTFSEEDRAVTGRVEWAAFFGDELYLFATEDNRRRFKLNPDRFVSTRVVQVTDIESVVR